MPEPEPFPGWRAARSRMLTFQRELNPTSGAAEFLERSPLIEGDFEPGGYSMSLKFLCSARDRELLLDPRVSGVRGQLEGALRAVLDDAPFEISIRPKYGTSDEIAAFRDDREEPAQLTR